jgi:WD40 repeat protein
MFVLDARPRAVTSLAFSPDSGTLFAAHRGGELHAWTLADRTSQPLSVGGKQMAVAHALLPGGRWAFGGVRQDGRPLYGERLLDLRTGADYPFTSHVDRGVAISPDAGRIFAFQIAARDPDRPLLPGTSWLRLYCHTVTPGGLVYAWHADLPEGVIGWVVGALGPDRFAHDEETRTSTPAKQQIVIRSAVAGRVEHVIDTPDLFPDQLLGSPDGTQLVARKGTALLAWDATDWNKPPVAVEGKNKGSMYHPAACFHPSAPFLLMANGGPSVLVFDTTTWKPVRKWNWRTGGVLRTLAISSDGTLAAAGGPRGTVVVWDLDL